MVKLLGTGGGTLPIGDTNAVVCVGDDGCDDPEKDGETERAVHVVCVECEASDGRRFRDAAVIFLKFMSDLGSSLTKDE